MELIRKIRKLNKNDAVLAGGKGAALGEMMSAGIPALSSWQNMVIALSMN